MIQKMEVRVLHRKPRYNELMKVWMLRSKRIVPGESVYLGKNHRGDVGPLIDYTKAWAWASKAEASEFIATYKNAHPDKVPYVELYDLVEFETVPKNMA